MPTKPTTVRATKIPVAGPPASAIKVRVDAENVASNPPAWRWNPREWASSLSLHAILLLAMGLWYFAPPANPPRRFDTRLMGSEFGVEEGMLPTGGLNTAIELLNIDETPEKPLFEYVAKIDPALTKIKPKPLKEVEPKVESTDKPSGAGGFANPNPGAGAGDGFGLAKFGNGGESIQGIRVKVGDPQFTLIWNSEADLDLHVIEPGGKDINWENAQGNYGGELDVDNTKGFGPENIYWLDEDPETGKKWKGKGPAGEYLWFVKFFGGIDGKIHPTDWKVRVKHAGKVDVYTGHFRGVEEQSKRYSLIVEGPPPRPPALKDQ